MCDRVFRGGLVRERLCVFTWLAAAAATAASATPAPAPPAFALALGPRFDLAFRHREFGFLDMLVGFKVLVEILRGWGHLWLLGRKIAGGFRCVHLLPAIDHI